VEREDQSTALEERFAEAGAPLASFRP
jgi:hypothetical protein